MRIFYTLKLSYEKYCKMQSEINIYLNTFKQLSLALIKLFFILLSCETGLQLF